METYRYSPGEDTSSEFRKCWGSVVSPGVSNKGEILTSAATFRIYAVSWMCT